MKSGYAPLTEFAVYDPYDVRPLLGKHYAFKRLGGPDETATILPATPQEQAQFAPLHDALREQARQCQVAHWEYKRDRAQAEAEQAGDAAQRGAVHQGRLAASAARDGRNRMGTRE